jgi:biopolymer transport protein ExbD
MLGTAPPPHHGAGPDLPVSRFANPMPRATREDAQIVSVTSDGTFYFGNTRVAIVEMHGRIRENLKNGADRKIHIRADARVKYGRLKEVLNEISTSEIQNVCFLTQKASP